MFGLILQIVCLACVIGFARESARRLARTRAARARLRPDIAAATPTTMAECAERLEIYDAWVYRDFTVWAAVWISFFALAVAPDEWLDRLSWPVALPSPLSVAMTVYVLGAVLSLVSFRRYLRRLGFDCPGGAHSLLWRRLPARWEVDARWAAFRRTGRCRCGHQIVTPPVH
jgi:hypothetical protein